MYGLDLALMSFADIVLLLLFFFVCFWGGFGGRGRCLSFIFLVTIACCIY